MAVAADEGHGEEVQEAAQVALEPVAGAAVAARAVVDWELGDPVATLVREHREEAMELAVDFEVAYDLGAVGLEPAVDVVETQPRDGARHAVEHARGQPPRPRVAAVALPAR